MCRVLETTRLARFRGVIFWWWWWGSVTRWGSWIVQRFDHQAELWGFFFLKRARILGEGCHFGKRIAFLGLQCACEVLISPCARCSDHILCPVGTHGRDKEFFLIRVCPSWKVRGLPPKAKIYSSSHAKFRLSQSLKISQSSSFFSLGNCVLLPRASNDLGNVPFCISLCSHNACNEALATPRKDPVLYCSVRAAYITGPLPIPAGKRCLVWSKHITVSQKNCPPRSSV